MTESAQDFSLLPRPGGASIAYAATPGGGPAVVFLGGFRSDMTGTKALALEGWARRAGRAFLRFDYFGHGRSSGDFADGTIGRWRDDALAVLDGLTEGKLVLVGSSMGGWIALLAGLARPQRLAGMVLIAPAPDFTEALLWARLGPAERQRLLAEGRLERPSAYSGEPDILTRRLIEEGRDHLVLDKPLRLACPVHILQGTADPDVPWWHARRLFDHLETPDTVLTLVKGGDHRLSRPADLARLVAVIESLG